MSRKLCSGSHEAAEYRTCNTAAARSRTWDERRVSAEARKRLPHRGDELLLIPGGKARVGEVLDDPLPQGGLEVVLPREVPVHRPFLNRCLGGDGGVGQVRASPHEPRML
jgi:hypothetical protein